MKNLLIAGLMATSATTVSAGVTNMAAMCEPYEDTINYMAEFGLQPLHISENATVLDEKGNSVSGTMVTWLGENGNMSVIFAPNGDSGVACVLIVAEKGSRFGGE